MQGQGQRAYVVPRLDRLLPTTKAEAIVLAENLKRLDVTLGTFLPIKKAGGAEFSLPEFCVGEMWTGLGTSAATPLPAPRPHQASAGLLLLNSAGGMVPASAGSAQPVAALALAGNDDSWEEGSEGEAEVSSAQKRACIRPATCSIHSWLPWSCDSYSDGIVGLLLVGSFVVVFLAWMAC